MPPYLCIIIFKHTIMSTTKIALVTGGSRGLGKDMAINLAKKGLDVILTYNSNKEEAQKTVQAINALGQKALSIQLNVADTKNYDPFVAKVKEALVKTLGTEKLDFVIPNAGIGHHQSFAETQEADIDNLYTIHFKQPYLLTQKLLPIMNDGGGIVNISSGLARFAMPGTSAYGALKAAVEQLTRYQAAELGNRKIRSNVVAPGAIETDFSGGTVRDNKEVNTMVSSSTALGRAGLPEDIGSVVAFLCTEDARWINAQRIEVSGGMRL